jgi:hypothetical protein
MVQATATPRVIGRKTQKRILMIDHIMRALTSPNVHTRVNPKNPEVLIQSFLLPELRKEIKNVYRSVYPEQREVTIARKSDEALHSECDISTPVHHIEFLGVRHRPDFVVEIDGTQIAIEVKRGSSGADVRSGLGQSLVYTTVYDFVCYLFIDVSPNRDIASSLKGPEESFLFEKLWEDFNIKFAVFPS